jgi:hypothetical protein
LGKVCYLIDPEEMLQAAQRGDVDKVRQLLASDTTLVNAKGAHNKTPLHWAAEKNYPELAELLVTAGADINAEVSWGMTPLQWAANMGSRDVAKVLLAHGAAPQLNMWAAAGLGMLDVVQSFWDSASPSTLKPGADQTRARDLSPQSGKSGQPGDPGLGDGKWGKAAPPEVTLSWSLMLFTLPPATATLRWQSFCWRKARTSIAAASSALPACTGPPSMATRRWWSF